MDALLPIIILWPGISWIIGYTIPPAPLSIFMSNWSGSAPPGDCIGAAGGVIGKAPGGSPAGPPGGGSGIGGRPGGRGGGSGPTGPPGGIPGGPASAAIGSAGIAPGIPPPPAIDSFRRARSMILSSSPIAPSCIVAEAGIAPDFPAAALFLDKPRVWLISRKPAPANMPDANAASEGSTLPSSRPGIGSGIRREPWCDGRDGSSPLSIHRAVSRCQ